MRCNFSYEGASEERQKTKWKLYPSSRIQFQSAPFERCWFVFQSTGQEKELHINGWPSFPVPCGLNLCARTLSVLRDSIFERLYTGTYFVNTKPKHTQNTFHQHLFLLQPFPIEIPKHKGGGAENILVYSLLVFYSDCAKFSRNGKYCDIFSLDDPALAFLLACTFAAFFHTDIPISLFSRVINEHCSFQN